METWFTGIYKATWQDLVRYLEALLGDGGTAQDIAQESMLKLLELGDGVVPMNQARFWLFRVARNGALNHMNRAKTRGGLVARVRVFLSRIAPHPEELLVREQTSRRLLRHLATLPEPQRSALLLRELEGLSYAEIADLMGVSISKVKTDIFRARSAMRAKREYVPAGGKS